MSVIVEINVCSIAYNMFKRRNDYCRNEDAKKYKKSKTTSTPPSLKGKKNFGGRGGMTEN